MENLTIKSPYAAFIFDRKGETQKGKEYGTLTIKIELFFRYAEEYLKQNNV